MGGRCFAFARTLALGVLFSTPGAQAHGQLYPALHAYEACAFSDGLQIAEIASLGQGIRSRTVETGKGTFPLPLLAGRRLMFAYPGSDFFANVKVEVLPTGRFTEEKKLVMENFTFILNGRGGNLRDERLPTKLRGFEAVGLIRPTLEGGVLGIYLLVDDATHIVSTIYFLNQEPERRKFATKDEHARLRTAFLNTYTACIRDNELRTGEQ